MDDGYSEAAIGSYAKDGSVSVYVDDIDADVVLSTQGLRHGLRRTKNLSADANAIVTLHAGEIVSHSIRINDLTPSKEDATSSFILIGAAKIGSDLYIVRSVVNRFELTSMNVLYAINAKKKSRVRSMRQGPRRRHRWQHRYPLPTLLLVYPLCSILSISIFPIFYRRMY